MNSVATNSAKSNQDLLFAGDRMLLRNSFVTWVEGQIIRGEILDSTKCNLSYVKQHELWGDIGYTGNEEWNFNDFDGDGDEDLIVSYEIGQCDGGNALWQTLKFAVILNTATATGVVIEDSDLILKFSDDKGCDYGSSECFEGVVRFGGITKELQIVIQDLYWSENSGRYPDKARHYYTTLSPNSNTLKVMRVTEE